MYSLAYLDQQHSTYTITKCMLLLNVLVYTRKVKQLVMYEHAIHQYTYIRM